MKFLGVLVFLLSVISQSGFSERVIARSKTSSAAMDFLRDPARVNEAMKAFDAYGNQSGKRDENFTKVREALSRLGDSKLSGSDRELAIRNILPRFSALQDQMLTGEANKTRADEALISIYGDASTVSTLRASYNRLSGGDSIPVSIKGTPSEPLAAAALKTVSANYGGPAAAEPWTRTLDGAQVAIKAVSDPVVKDLAQKALDLQLFFTAKGVDNVDNNTSKAGKVNPHDQADLFNPGRITEILRGEDPEQVKAALEGMVNMFEPIRASLAEQLGLPKTASMAEISAKMTESGKPGLFAKAWDAWAKDPFMLGKVKEILGKGKEGVEMLRTLCGLGNRKPCISPGAAMCRAVAAAVGASGVTIAGVKLTEALFMSDDAYPTKDVVGDSELADRSKAGSPAEQTHGATPPVKKGRSQ